ncbi:hypothetical protein [Streptomyces sp. NPDC048282]|uniref:hypothetical protein n=1 Tax=Streptomyces sp. NPDC048282 TaxID=3365528 RepID=UPI0037118560
MPHAAAQEMRSPILSIHPYVPAVEQNGNSICSLASRGECSHKLVAEVRVEFSDGTTPRWRVCGAWLTGNPSAIAHITANGFQEPVVF